MKLNFNKKDKIYFSIIIAIFCSYLLYIGQLQLPIGTIVTDSMEPNIKTGSVLIITTINHPIPIVDDTIHTTHQVQNENFEHESFGKQGSVIAFKTENHKYPIIHRAHYKTEKGEKWTKNIEFSKVTTVPCSKIATCPAPHSGYITKGDGNYYYDQTSNIKIIRESDVIGIVKHDIRGVGKPRELLYKKRN